MNTVVILSIALIVLLTISVLASMKHESSISIPQVEFTELDYLYSYRNALIKVLQIESELDSVRFSLDYYTNGRDTFFSPIETLHIKQQIKQNIKELTNSYEQGALSLIEFHYSLDHMLRQLDALIFRPAA
ncbi:hypothetical protein FFF34_019425 [Inquilinus sp. KBS0705]|nr:hypothetical protein FFF34_019425 [Inquilinus sp. KBS0705]